MNYKAEDMFVKFLAGITINILLQSARNKMRNKFLIYSAKDNKCRNITLSILESNDLLNATNDLFTKQSTESYISTDLTKLTNTITGIGVKIDVIRQGGDLLY